MSVSQYSASGHFIRKYADDNLKLRLVIANNRVRLVKNRRGEVREIHMLTDEEPRLSLSNYTGQRYSHNRADGDKKTGNIEKVWTLKKLDAEDEDLYSQVRDSVTREASAKPDSGPGFWAKRARERAA